MTTTRSITDTRLFELIGEADPLITDAAPTDADTEAALRSLLASGPGADARPAGRSAARHPRRLALRAGIGVTAAGVIAFAAVNLLPSSPTPVGVSDALAKRVIAHTAAAVAGSGSGIVHIVETTTSTNYTGTYQSWDSQTTPDMVWETNQEGPDNTTGPDTSILTVSADTLETYDAASNTLHVVHRVPPSRVVALEADGNPAYSDALQLTEEEHVYPGTACCTTAPTGGASSFQVPTFSDLIVALLRAPGVTVNPDASVNGKSAISITGKSGPSTLSTLYTLYVQPQTYTPLQLVETGPTSGTDAAPFTVTTTFNTYETLPAGSISMPNLAQLHPNAKVISTLITTDGPPAS